MQTPARTIAKSLSWQALGLVTTTAIAYALTGSMVAGGTMALTMAGVGAVLFVAHERAWERVRWGRGPEG